MAREEQRMLLNSLRPAVLVALEYNSVARYTIAMQIGSGTEPCSQFPVLVQVSSLRLCLCMRLNLDAFCLGGCEETALGFQVFHSCFDCVLSQHAAMQLDWRQAQVLCNLTILNTECVVQRFPLHPLCCNTAACNGRPTPKCFEHRIHDVAIIINLLTASVRSGRIHALNIKGTGSSGNRSPENWQALPLVNQFMSVLLCATRVIQCQCAYIQRTWRTSHTLQ